MAETTCDVLYEFFFPKADRVEDFRPTLIAICVFNSFLSYTVIILNIVTIHVIRKTASLPKPLRTLLLSLAVSDVGVGLLAQPLYIFILVSRLQQKDIDCLSYKGLLAVIYIFCLSSLLNLVTISVDRFLAVYLHLRYQELVTHKRVVAAVISMWLLSAAINSSFFCAPLFNISRVITLVTITVCLILVVSVNWKIHKVLERHRDQIQGLQIQQEVQNGDLSNFLRLRKSAVGAFYVCIVFLICYLPSYILSILKLAHPSGSISLQRAQPYVMTLFFLNSSLNPVIYCWKMRPIRLTLIDILRGIINRFRQ